MLLSAAQEEAGQENDAISTLELTLEENPEFFRGYVRLAELDQRQRRFQDAADAYGQAQAANSRADLGARRAASLINAGKPAQARDLLQADIARKTAPDAASLYMLAQSQRMLKDLVAAAATAQKLKTAFPNDARGPYLEAQLLEDRGRTDEAIASFGELVKRSPDDASLVLEYANLLEKGGRVADAERTLRDLLAKDPARREHAELARVPAGGSRSAAR